MRKTKALAVALVAILLVQVFAVLICAASYDDEFLSESPFVPTYIAGSYGEFLQNHARTLDDIAGKIVLDVSSPTSRSDNVKIETVSGRENVVVTYETGFVEFKFNVETAGLYVLGIDYYTSVGKGGSIERKIRINGEVPYTEAGNASLDRIYRDDVDYSSAQKDENGIYSGLFEADKQGNETRPRQEEVHTWVDNAYFKDSSGSYFGALKFYLHKGENTLRLESVRENVAISSLYFYTISSNRSYSEWLLEKQSDGLSSAGDRLISKVQAEYPTRKSSTQLFAGTDRSSAATEPSSANLKKLNTIGGETWATIGDWIEYDVDVAEEGLYKLVIRYRQNVNSGLFSSRAITVNGEYPFEENSGVKFVYDSAWQTLTPSDEYGEPLLFHFRKGKNTVRFEAVPGDMEEIINAVDSIVRQLQSDYRKILVVTGSSPDVNQDYELDSVLPEVVSDFKAQGDLLYTISNKLLKILGKEGSQTAQLNSVINDLYSWNADPDKIPRSVDQINSDVSTLGDFVSTCRSQALELDYFLIAQSDFEAPAAETGFFPSLWHQIQLFLSSFSSDLNSISGDRHTEYSDYARVWTVTNRDYAILLRQVIDRNFINQYGVDLELQLYPGVLTNSVLAGDICDVYLNMPVANVQDYGARNILQPLNFYQKYSYDVTKKDGTVTGTATVDGFKEMKSRFPDAVWPGVSLEREKNLYYTYGLPETIDFPVLFYRTDIIEEYNIPIPETWDDYYDLIPLLQKYSMEIAAPTLDVLIYQYDSTKYLDGGRRVNIGSDTYLDLFTKINEFYTLYNCPIEFNAQNRFKSGEMPFLYGTMAMWTTLTVYCPEISGLWSMASHPGVRQADGSINNVLVPTVTYCVMMADAANKESGWKFMQWWTDDVAQEEYGREYESITGQTARYTSANTQAFLSAPWSAAEMSILSEQLNALRGAEVAIGDYLSVRYLEFARNEVIVDGTGDGIDTILEHINEINRCIANKRLELELPE